jgi:peroxiredoxin
MVCFSSDSIMTGLSWVLAVLAGILLAAVFAVLYHLIQQNGRVLLRLESLERQLREQGIPIADGENPLPAGLPVGTVLNDFSLPSLSGETVRLSQWKGRRLLLIFFHPECSFCRAFLESLGAFLKNGAAPAVAPLFVSRGSADENRRLFEEHGIRFPVLLQEDAEVSSLFRIPGTPVGYVVDENRATASEMLVGEEPILRALGAAAAPRATGKVSRSVAESKIVRDGLKAGTPAPDFTLPSLDGPDVSLRDYRGRKVLLVFSDPECQPCARMAPDLERIHRAANGLQVLMISRGDIEANRRKVAEQALTFPVVLQRHWEISRAYGMFATPIAYLVDEGGVISTDVAVGADPILRLAR